MLAAIPFFLLLTFSSWYYLDPDLIQTLRLYLNMAPHLRVLAGTSLDSLVPLTTVNTNQPFAVKSELFEGEIVANIKGFTNDDGDVIESEYFARPDRQGITWSIAVQGSC